MAPLVAGAIVVGSLGVAATGVVNAQNAPSSANLAATLEHAQATRVSGPTLRVNGTLDDAAWAQAQPITEFVQKIPVEGATPSVTTEVRQQYDDHALYVGARLRRKDPHAIRTSITRRDGESRGNIHRVAGHLS